MYTFIETDVDTHGRKTETVSCGAAPPGGSTDCGATKGGIDPHPEVVPPHHMVVEVIFVLSPSCTEKQNHTLVPSIL